MQDGIGAQYSGIDRASEDSITVDGKVYKLGTSRHEYDPSDLMAPRRIHTSKSPNPNRFCELNYTPISHIYDGLNLLLIAFEQEMTYGIYNGKCVIDGTILEIKDMWGLLETVSTRL